MNHPAWVKARQNLDIVTGPSQSRRKVNIRFALLVPGSSERPRQVQALPDLGNHLSEETCAHGWRRRVGTR